MLQYNNSSEFFNEIIKDDECKLEQVSTDIMTAQGTNHAGLERKDFGDHKLIKQRLHNLSRRRKASLNLN